MRHRVLLPSLLVLAAAGVSQAAEGSFWEIRADLGIAPGISDVTFTDPGGTETLKLDETIGFFFAPGVVWGTSFGTQGFGAVVGANLFYRTGGGEGKDFQAPGDKLEVTSTAYGLTLLAGVTYTMDAWNFQFGPHLGFGINSTDIDYSDPGNPSESMSGDGNFVNFGVTVRGTYAFNQNMSAGLIIGYDSFTADAEMTDSGGGKFDAEAKGSGLLFALTAGWKL